MIFSRHHSLLCRLAFIFLFSFTTHIPGLLNPILDFHGWAQTLRASIARNYYKGGMNFFRPQVDFQGNDSHHAATQFPLYSYLIAVTYKIFGENDFCGRILSVFFAGLSSVSLYLLAKLFLSEQLSLISALVFCCIPIRIYFMRTVMPESMAIFSLLAGFYFTARWSDTDRFFPQGLFSCFFLALSSLLKLPYIFLIPPALFLMLQKQPRTILRNKKIWSLSLFVIGSVGSWYLYTLSGTQVLVSEQGFLRGEIHPAVWGDIDFWTTHFLSRFPELLTTYAGLFFFFVGFNFLWKEKLSFFIVWFVSTLFYIILCGGYGKIHQYASLPFAPINAIFIAVGMVRIWEKWRFKRCLQLLFVFLVISVPVHAALRIRHWYELELWVLRLKEAVKEISKPSDLFYINAKDQPFFLYHIQRKGFAGSIQGHGMDYFEQSLKKGVKFFFTPIDENWKEHEIMFNQRFKLVYRAPDFLIYDVTSK